jgi:hypothetical protein
VSAAPHGPPVEPTDPGPNRRRQRHQLGVLAWFLIAAGLVILMLDRVPLPARLLTGFVDLVAGAGLLVLRRQKFPDVKKTSPR